MPHTHPIPLVDPLLGTQVGDYRVESVIGEGGMGVVYRGVHPVIGKPVAIKVLKASLAKNKGLTERLIEEARAVNAIGHRNIIDIFGLGELPDGRPYIVMEQLAGEPLDELLRRERRLTERAAVELLLELCAPLEAAHRAGVVHRDLKPANVFLCDQVDGGPRFVKLLDFGLARRTSGFGSSTQQTNRAFIIGTPNYLSPEQATGSEISDRTDVYALGVMLYEFLTGSVPFTGNNAIEVAMAHVNQPAPRVTELAPLTSPTVTTLIERMLAKRAEDRPSVEEVRRTLAPNAPPRVAPAPKLSESGRIHRDLTVTLMRPQPRTGGRTWAIAGGVAVVAIGLLGFALLRTGAGGTTPSAAGDAEVGGSGAGGDGARAGTGASAGNDGARAGNDGARAGTGASAGNDGARAGNDAVRPGNDGASAGNDGARAGNGGAGAGPGASAGGDGARAGTGASAGNDGAQAGGSAGRDGTAAATGATGDGAGIGTGGSEGSPGTSGGGSRTTAAPSGVGGDRAGPRQNKARAPTSEELTRRIAELERRLRGATPKGEEPDPLALKLLGSYRLKAELASSAEERLDIARRLDSWQRTHL